MLSEIGDAPPRRRQLPPSSGNGPQRSPGAKSIMWVVTHMGMGQYLLIPFLVGWTSIYKLFWCSPGVQGFDTLPYVEPCGTHSSCRGSMPRSSGPNLNGLAGHLRAVPRVPWCWRGPMNGSRHIFTPPGCAYHQQVDSQWMEWIQKVLHVWAKLHSKRSQ